MALSKDSAKLEIAKDYYRQIYQKDISAIDFAPYELPVGILLAFIGGPFFIYLILKNKGGGLD